MFASVRSGTMSRSKVATGAPWMTPHTPPTTMNATFPSTSARNSAATSAPAGCATDGLERPDIRLENLQPLGGRERKHPSNQGQIDAVFRERAIIERFAGLLHAAILAEGRQP